MITVKDTYRDKLADPRWEARRQEILAIDGYACIFCGKKKGVQVHHLRYGRMEPWDYPDQFLITLCDNHHGAIHDRTKELQAENILIAAIRRLKLNPMEMLELVGVVGKHKTHFQKAIETRNEGLRTKPRRE